MSISRLEHTRNEIRRTARHMFSTRGFTDTSIRDIAGGVGIKGASMYNHFSSKEDILWDLTLAALETLMAEWRVVDAQLEGADATSRLAGFVRVHARYHAEHSSDARIVNGELRRLNPAHLETASAIRAEYERVLRQLVEKHLSSTGATVPDLQITVYAILQMGIAIADWYQPGGRLSVDQIAELYAELALKMVRT